GKYRTCDAGGARRALTGDDDVDTSDLIWMNGELLAWEDAKVHVLTHGLHYGTGVFEGIRCYDTELGPTIFRNSEHMERLLQSSELYYMAVPYTAPELLLHPPDRLPRLWLDGPEPDGRARGRHDRLLGVGHVSGRGGHGQRHSRQGLFLAAHLARFPDPARQGLRPVPQ